MSKILFIDADHREHSVIRTVLPREYTIIALQPGPDVLDAVRRERPAVVLFNIDSSPVDGLALVTGIVALTGAPPVVILGSAGRPAQIVRLIRAGAHDYVVKPIDRIRLLDSLLAAIASCVCVSKPCANAAKGGFIGQTPHAAEVRRGIEKFAATRSNVLLMGESGTGKGLVARIIHDLSDRCGGPFLARNCAAIPETLFESEVFGSERGAFTGAVHRAGVFEAAAGGTLFLDEIAEIPVPVQAKLLRAVEDREIVRVGGTRPVAVDVRLLTATNRDVKALVKKKEFRSDLYYRINTLTMTIPPLRHRKEDIPLLLATMLERSDGVTITHSAARKLVEYDWPGNVRELFNVIERAIVYADDHVITPAAISFDG